MTAEWYLDIFREVFFFIDSIIYVLIEAAYNLLKDVAGITIIRQSTVDEFIQRVYIFIGIFMLFKVAFSLLTMFVNPDTANDKNSGGGKIVTRIFISLGLVVLVPTIFDFALDFQKTVLEQNILGNLILGVETDQEENQITYDNAGRVVSITIFKSFFYPVDYSSGYCDSHSDEVFCKDPATTNISVYDFEDKVREKENPGWTLNNKYTYDYSILVSSIVGFYVAKIFIVFTFDVAVRSIKLAFLAMIAPVPILSYIDEKKGNQVFNNWLKTCGSTYLDLFIRLGAVFFAVFFIAELTAGEGLVTMISDSSFGLTAQWMIICGILTFAKELPQLIYDILGIKPKGGFTFSIRKKIQTVPVVGAATTRAAAAVGGAYESLRNNKTGNRLRAALSGAAAGFSSVDGKVPMMGADIKGAPVKGFSLGRAAGYEDATGNKMRAYNPFKQLFRESASNDVKELKSKRAIIQQEKISIDLDLKRVEDALLNAQKELKENPNNQQLQEHVRQLADTYNKVALASNNLDSDISKLSNQIKQVETNYNLDASPQDQIDEIMRRFQDENGEQLNTIDKYLQKQISKDENAPSIATVKEEAEALINSINSVERRVNETGKNIAGGLNQPNNTNSSGNNNR